MVAGTGTGIAKTQTRRTCAAIQAGGLNSLKRSGFVVCFLQTVDRLAQKLVKLVIRNTKF
jgi:hypothetical protein